MADPVDAHKEHSAYARRPELITNRKPNDALPFFTAATPSNLSKTIDASDEIRDQTRAMISIDKQ